MTTTIQSNETLVKSIQSGERELLYTLWEQLEDLVKWYANRHRLPPSSGADFDDVVQCGYPALVRAVEGYDASQGEDTFNGYFLQVLRSEIARWTGHRSAKQQQDPLKHCMRLDVPVRGDDPDYLLIDTVSDPVDAYEEVERDIYNEQLRTALDEALAVLPGRCEEVLRLVYYDGLTQKEAAEAMGCAPQYVSANKDMGLRKLRQNHRLDRWLDDRTDWLYHVGVKRFRNTGTSSVEAIVLHREEMRERYELSNSDVTKQN